jgi:hypothetical protein
MTRTTDIVQWDHYQDWSSTAPEPREFWLGSARFNVWAETKPGSWINVYRGNDEERTHDTMNRWDRRVNVHMIDRSKLTIEQRWTDLFWRIQNDPDYGNQEGQTRIGEARSLR